MANDPLARDCLQLKRIPDHAVNQVKRPHDTGPEIRAEPNLVRSAKLGFNPLAGESPDLFRGTLTHVAPSPIRTPGRLTCDVTDGPEAHCSLDVPADHAIGLWTHGEQVHLAETVLDATDGEVACSIEPLLDQTFCE